MISIVAGGSCCLTSFTQHIWAGIEFLILLGILSSLILIELGHVIFLARDTFCDKSNIPSVSICRFNISTLLRYLHCICDQLPLLFLLFCFYFPGQVLLILSFLFFFSLLFLAFELSELIIFLNFPFNMFISSC